MKHILFCAINADRTYASFYIGSTNDKNAADIIRQFNVYYDKRQSAKDREIEGVNIVVVSPIENNYDIRAFYNALLYQSTTGIYMDGDATVHGGSGGGSSSPEPQGPPTDPCTKAKAQVINNPQVQSALADLKKGITERGGKGEDGFKYQKNGTIAGVASKSDHHVDFGYKGDSKGAYHNHTDGGIHMFSPQDIDQMLGFARAQGSAEGYDSAFVGMIAQRGNTFVNYTIRFKGSYSELIGYNFTDDELKKYKKDIEKEYYNP